MEMKITFINLWLGNTDAVYNLTHLNEIFQLKANSYDLPTHHWFWAQTNSKDSVITNMR